MRMMHLDRELLREETMTVLNGSVKSLIILHFI